MTNRADLARIRWHRARMRIAAAALLAAPAAALAHHSGLYDEQRIIALEGAITAIAWVNPHVRLTLETTTADGGGTTLWEIEGTSVNALERWGIGRDTFQVGDRVNVKGPQSRYGRNAMIAATVQRPDGELVILWPNVAARLGLAETGVAGAGLFPPPSARTTDQPTRPAAPAPPATATGHGIFRIWTPRGRPAAQELPLTDAAREKARAYNALEDDPALRCEPPGMPVMLDTPYPLEFVDRGEQIVMRFEEWDGVRTIYMNPGKGPPVQEHSPNGVSFGRWEGATLAIFTTYVSYPYFDDLGTPQSEAVTVLERYTPTADETRLDWQVTVTDPATFTTPVVRRGFMAFEPGEVIKPYNCTLP
ncbi:MAG TPA: DUF6152 family protein [Gammaproteobacteria bacterium]